MRQKLVHSPVETSARSFCVLVVCDVPVFIATSSASLGAGCIRPRPLSALRDESPLLFELLLESRRKRTARVCVASAHLRILCQFVPDTAAGDQGGRTGHVLRSILVRRAPRRVLHQHSPRNDNNSLFKFQAKQVISAFDGMRIRLL